MWNFFYSTGQEKNLVMPSIIAFETKMNAQLKKGTIPNSKEISNVRTKSTILQTNVNYCHIPDLVYAFHDKENG